MNALPPSGPATEIPTRLPFRAVLVPHRSLTPRGFLILMCLFGGLSFATGIAFYAIGAWPVLGFFGLDVALVYLAFKLNYRAARATETVEVDRDALTVTWTNARGHHHRSARLSSTWTRLEELETPDGGFHLQLASRGRSIAIARHMSSDERRTFAVALRAALRLVREPDRP